MAVFIDVPDICFVERQMTGRSGIHLKEEQVTSHLAGYVEWHPNPPVATAFATDSTASNRYNQLKLIVQRP